MSFEKVITLWTILQLPDNEFRMVYYISLILQDFYFILSIVIEVLTGYQDVSYNVSRNGGLKGSIFHYRE